MTIQEACDELNRRKWRGRDDWHVYGIPGGDQCFGSVLSWDERSESRIKLILDPEDAFALAQGFIAQDRVAVIEQVIAERDALRSGNQQLKKVLAGNVSVLASASRACDSLGELLDHARTYSGELEARLAQEIEQRKRAAACVDGVTVAEYGESYWRDNSTPDELRDKLRGLGERLYETEQRLAQSQSETKSAWINRDRFCHWINEIARLFWGDDKQSYAPDAIYRIVEKLQKQTAGLIALANEVIRLDEEDCGLAANDGLDVMNLFQLARDALAALPKDNARSARRG